MVGLEKIEAYIYIYHMNLKFNLPVVPDSIQDTLPISFNQEPVLARSAPQITFGSAGPRTLQVNLKFHRQMFCLENPEVVDGIKVIKVLDPVTGTMINTPLKDAADLLIDALVSISLPKYTDSTKAIVPPSVLIRFGNESCIRGVPSGFSKTASGVWLKNGKLSEVLLNFTMTEIEPYSAQYAAANGTMRGVTTNLQRGIYGTTRAIKADSQRRV